jgi:hypothetical protein
MEEPVKLVTTSTPSLAAALGVFLISSAALCRTLSETPSVQTCCGKVAL